jgi:hypothetical protein
MGETCETCETGENFDLFRRRIPAFNGTLTFDPFTESARFIRKNYFAVTRDRETVSPMIGPERRNNTNILTGLAGLTGLADSTPAR